MLVGKKATLVAQTSSECDSGRALSMVAMKQRALVLRLRLTGRFGDQVQGQVNTDTTNEDFSMSTFEAYDEPLRAKIVAMSSGQEAGLREILGEDVWLSDDNPGQKKEFGKWFKEAVKQGRYPELEWVRIENSGRYDVYRKR
jgi:hypothetical protein